MPSFTMDSFKSRLLDRVNCGILKTTSPDMDVPPSITSCKRSADSKKESTKTPSSGRTKYICPLSFRTRLARVNSAPLENPQLPYVLFRNRASAVSPPVR